MIIIAQIEFPPQMAKEIGKCFLKLPPLPDYLKINGPYVRASEDDGMKVITLYVCDNTHISEALLAVNNRLTGYYDVKGFTYSCDVWLHAPEALTMIGLA
jgi:hypothetical protein